MDPLGHWDLALYASHTYERFGVFGPSWSGTEEGGGDRRVLPVFETFGSPAIP